MTQNLLIGTRGWAHAPWTGDFYPEELPAEWRFCYYSNRIRSVLVPHESWAQLGPGEIASWVDDSDAQFRFVLEPPPILLGASRAAVDEFFALAAPLWPLTAGLLVRMPAGPPDLACLDRLVSALAAHAPVCVDLAPAQRSAAALGLLARRQASLCWYPEQAPQPAPQGRFLAALARNGDARTVRRWIESLARWQGEARQAALFFDGAADAPRHALDARVLAELLGV